MARVIKILILVMFVSLLAWGAFRFATAQPKGIPNTAGETEQRPVNQVSAYFHSNAFRQVRDDALTSVQSTPATWFGLVASLFGALLFWMSVMWIARRRRY